jgi:hypothetical protein
MLAMADGEQSSSAIGCDSWMDASREPPRKRQAETVKRAAQHHCEAWLTRMEVRHSDRRVRPTPSQTKAGEGNESEDSI